MSVLPSERAYFQTPSMLAKGAPLDMTKSRLVRARTITYYRISGYDFQPWEVKSGSESRNPDSLWIRVNPICTIGPKAHAQLLAGKKVMPMSR